MAYTLTEAAKAVNRNKTTVLRAIKRGRLSGSRDEATGEWRIEPAELHRFYGTVAATATAATANATPRSDDATAELHARLDDKDALIAAHEAALNDLRQRLTESERERREQAARIVALLTDQRTAPPAPARHSWWLWRRRA